MLGKTAGKDAAAGKPTYPALYGLDESRRRARASLEQRARALRAAGLGGQLPAIARVGRRAHELKKGRGSTRCSSNAGWSPSRERARALILAGQVRVNGQPATKAGHTVQPEDEVHARRRPIIPMSAAAASSWPMRSTSSASLRPGGMALDIGASTGGFTDVLLQRGATHGRGARRRARAARLEAAQRSAGHRDRAA